MADIPENHRPEKFVLNCETSNSTINVCSYPDGAMLINDPNSKVDSLRQVYLQPEQVEALKGLIFRQELKRKLQS